VTLSQVPYTGLDLGPVGTALYWLFLVLWCAVAAYLIAVKRIHNTVLNWGYARLFGTTEATHPAYTTEAAHAEMPVRRSVKEVYTDATDDFILSQINRAA
jgi:hypothetical protein